MIDQDTQPKQGVQLELDPKFKSLHDQIGKIVNLNGLPIDYGQKIFSGPAYIEKIKYTNGKTAEYEIKIWPISPGGEFPSVDLHNVVLSTSTSFNTNIYKNLSFSLYNFNELETIKKKIEHSKISLPSHYVFKDQEGNIGMTHKIEDLISYHVEDQIPENRFSVINESFLQSLEKNLELSFFEQNILENLAFYAVQDSLKPREAYDTINHGFFKEILCKQLAGLAAGSTLAEDLI